MITLDVQNRPPLCRLLICSGRTCGSNSEIPKESLTEAWKDEGLHATVSMKITECQDACEHASIARIITASGTEWFEHLKAEHYQALLDWARECHRSGALVERPAVLAEKCFRGRIRDQ